jgi:hypothetical protein
MEEFMYKILDFDLEISKQGDDAKSCGEANDMK